MPAKSEPRQLLFMGGLALLLFWSAFDYGGRYLNVQVFTQVLAAGLLFFFTMRLQRRGDLTLLLNYPLLKVALLWLLALGLSWIFSVNRLASLEEALRILMYLSMSLVVYGWFVLAEEPERQVQQLVAIALATGCGVSLLGWWMLQRGESLSSTFHRTNDLAGYLLLLVPLALHQLLQARSWLSRLFYGLAVLILSISLLLTNSRTSWLAGVFAILWVCWYHRRVFQERLGRWALVILLVGLGATLLFNAHHILPRLQTLWSLHIFQENATHWRVALLRAAWRMFLDQPLVGQGLNTYGTAMPAFQHQVGFYSINPHNYYLQMLAETGLIGLVAFLIWLFQIFKSFRPAPNTVSFGILAGLSASLFHIGFDIDWSVSAIPLLFALLLGAGLVPRESWPDRAAEVPPPRVATGLLTFVGLILMLLPSMNYFSAMAYQDGAAKLDKGDDEGAFRDLKRAIHLAPWPSARHHYSLAKYYQEQQELPLAEREVQRAIQLNRHNAEYYLLASQLLSRLNQPTEALAMLLRRAELNPYRHPDIYSDLGDFYLHYQKDSLKALEWYQRGAETFPVGALGHYEIYTPGDRYELFNLYQKEALVLDQLNRSSEAQPLRDRAQKLIRHAVKDLYIQSGYRNPVAAVLAYWKEVAEYHSKPSHHFSSVHPQAQIPPPPPGRLDAQTLQFVYVERDYFTAKLVYALPVIGPKNQPESQRRWVTLEDQLVGAEDGWKIVSRRLLGR